MTEFGSTQNAGKTVALVMPVYDDWGPAVDLLRGIDTFLKDADVVCHAVLVDDGSPSRAPADAGRFPHGRVVSVRVVRLARNLGHQRAIVVGCYFAWKEISCDAVVVMDSDGEDRPEDVPRLLEEARTYPEHVIAAERTKRPEGPVFRFGYGAFRRVFRVLTGTRIRSGNFNLLPAVLLPRLLSVSETWNHFSAALMQSRLPVRFVPCLRRRRSQGTSHMGFTALVRHGLSAVSVFGDTVGIRMLAASLVLIALATGGIGIAAAVCLFTGTVVATWAVCAAGILFLVILQGFLISLAMSLQVLASRSAAPFLPARDCGHFIHVVDEMAVLP